MSKKYAVVSDHYSQDPYLSTVEDFLEMCQEVFGRQPELHESFGDWYDEDGELVLTDNPKEIEIAKKYQ